MAVEELKKETEKVELERNKRYQLFEIRNNLEEIRTISEQTCTYAVELYPDIVCIPDWSLVPRIVMEYVKATYDFLKSKRTKDMRETFVDFGDFVHFGIEFGTTENADKDATFNPIITVKSELMYDNDTKNGNKLKREVPDINLNNDIEVICQGAKNVLKSKFGVIIEDWRNIAYITLSFFRIAKDYLIKNKDAEGIGLIINLGEVLDLCIEKYGDDENPKYAINFGAGKSLKMDYAKSDEKSENN